MRNLIRVWIILTALLVCPVYPEENFLGGPEDRNKLLIVGTFHFKDAGLDDYKPKFDIDVLSPARQKEVAEVVRLLSGFRPTKVALEIRKENEPQFQERYQQYLQNKFDLPANEIYQLGFRVAKECGLKRIESIDVKGRVYDPDFDLKKYAEQNGQQALLNSAWQARFERLYSHDDELKMKQTLRQHLLHINSEERILQGHGHYLIGDFGIGKDQEYPGVDSITGWWYNRNLRIFENVRRITKDKEDRILLLIGAGHVPIIRHAAQASPEFHLVEVSDYLK